MDVDRPLPTPITPEAKPFWEACRAEKLMLPRCEECGHVFFYPRILCPRCHSRRIGWMQATLRSSRCRSVMVAMGLTASAGTGEGSRRR